MIQNGTVCPDIKEKGEKLIKYLKFRNFPIYTEEQTKSGAFYIRLGCSDAYVEFTELMCYLIERIEMEY